MKAWDAFAATLGTSGVNRNGSIASAGTTALGSSNGGSGVPSNGAPSNGRGLLFARFALAVAVVALAVAFGASPALAAGPTVTIEEAKNIEYTSIDVEGTVNPEGFPTQWRFEYISDEEFQKNLAESHPGFTNAIVPFASTAYSTETVGGHIEGLHAGTEYHLRLFARNVHGSQAAVAPNFTTTAVAPPVLSEVEATEVEYATMVAEGKVEIAGSDPAFNATVCRFEVASQQQWEASGNAFPVPPFLDPSREPKVVGCDVEPTGPGTTTVKATFGNLAAGTEYHLRLVAGNQSGDPVSLEASTFETKPVAKAAVTGPNVSSITAYTAHVSGTVAPNAPTPVTDAIRAGYNVHWYFTCTPTCYPNASGEVEAGEPATEVSADLSLEPNLEYTVTLHAVNAAGDETAQATFSTPAVAPEVSNSFPGSVINRTPTGARLVGLVNPHNSQLTDCHFEYGTTTSYGQVVPCSENPTGNVFLPVGADVTGLQPSTTYHFRLVAADGVGPAVGADQVFRTLAMASPPSCGNEEARAEQKAQILSECRAWEMVSPQDKNGGSVTSEATNVLASSDGNAAVFASRAGFADDKSTGPVGMTQYAARRGADGWTTNAISPVQNNGVLQTLFTRDEAGVFSEDLSKAAMFGYDLPGASDDLPHETNLYSLDTITGELQTVTQAAQAENLGFAQFINNIGVGASSDLGVIAFETPSQLLPEATPFTTNVYEWDHGVLRVAGVLPNGEVSPEGSTQPGTNVFFYRYRDSVSSDGSRVAFLAPKEGQNQLYLRRNHSSTAWVSEPEGSSPVTAPENVYLQWMSPDGKRLLFTTTSQLLDSDTNGNTDLYLYTDGPNPTSESNLELITSSSGSAGEGVLGASEDASRIYYLSSQQLIYWDHGVTKKIAEFHGSTFEEAGATSYPGNARVSADGMDVAFLSEEPLTGQAGKASEYTYNNELYVYNAADESLTCASCLTSGPTADEATVEANATHQGLTKPMPEVRPHWLSADGKKVFFSTAAPLVAEDTNGLEDAYVYNTETGEQRLISSGRGEAGAWFEDASANGSDVLFVTRQSLLARDGDELVDLYDARVGGGFVEPPPPPTPCSGDGCRGRLSTGSSVSSPATSSFSGPGNPHPKRKKHHKRHRRHRHHHHKGHKNKRNQGSGK